MTEERTLSDDGIAKAWVDLHLAGAGSLERDAHFWAYESLDDLRNSDLERYWRIIVRIRQLDDSDVVLSNLAAGPMEDLLVTAGDDFIDRIEASAETDGRFKDMLAMVWRNAISEPVWTRLQMAATRK